MIRSALAFALGLVDVKVCAADDVRSGLKLMVRRSGDDAPEKPLP